MKYFVKFMDVITHKHVFVITTFLCGLATDNEVVSAIYSTGAVLLLFMPNKTE